MGTPIQNGIGGYEHIQTEENIELNILYMTKEFKMKKAIQSRCPSPMKPTMQKGQ